MPGGADPSVNGTLTGGAMVAGTPKGPTCTPGPAAQTTEPGIRTYTGRRTSPAAWLPVPPTSQWGVTFGQVVRLTLLWWGLCIVRGGAMRAHTPWYRVL